MNNLTINIIFVAVLLGVATVGALLGFGRSLKLSTKGVFGIVLSVALCVLFGGTLLTTNSIGEFVARGNDYFRGVWFLLGVIRLATILYFIVLLFVFQVLRIIIVAIIKQVAEADIKGVRVINKVGGAVFLTGFVFALCLLGLAGIRLFENTGLINEPMGAIQNTFLYTLYVYNPIMLGGSA